MCVLSSMSDECLHMRQVLMQGWRPVEPENPPERFLYQESPWHGDWSCCIYFSFCDHFMSFVFLQAHLQLRRPQMGPRPHELAGARGESLCIVRRTFSDHSYELIGFLPDHV